MNKLGVKAVDTIILIAEHAALCTLSVYEHRYSQNTLRAIVKYLTISYFECSSGFFIDAKFKVT